MITTAPIPETQFQTAFQIKMEYLDDEPFEIFHPRYRTYPDLFVGCFQDQTLIGVCYGWPFSDDFPEETGKILLKGITIIHPFSGKGYGSQLLGCFEEQVRKRGRWTITLGSAEGYVEHFYLKNGYQPVEYLIRVPKDALALDDQQKGYPIVKERWEGAEKILKIQADTYQPEFKGVLKEAFQAREVIYIFEKTIA